MVTQKALARCRMSRAAVIGASIAVAELLAAYSLPSLANGPQEPGPPRPVAEAKPAAPGQFEVDEQAAERALERTLVAAGALLIPFGQAEVEPAFTYTRRENDSPALTVVGGGLIGVSEEFRRDEFQGNLSVRIGLPLDAQFELGLPYNFVQQQRVINLGAAGRRSLDGTNQGLGDINIGLAKTLLRERGWRPDLIGRVTWDSNSGELRDHGIRIGDGFNNIIGSLTALKRQDPIAFVAGASYQKSFEENNIEPGDQIRFTLGALLAASPETSLRLVLDQAFFNDLKIRNTTVNNSDQVQGVLTVGASSILGRNLLLDVAAGIGLTDDAPDYAVRISLPIRFDMPFL